MFTSYLSQSQSLSQADDVLIREHQEEYDYYDDDDEEENGLENEQQQQPRYANERTDAAVAEAANDDDNDDDHHQNNAHDSVVQQAAMIGVGSCSAAASPSIQMMSRPLRRRQKLILYQQQQQQRQHDYEEEDTGGISAPSTIGSFIGSSSNPFASLEAMLDVVAVERTPAHRNDVPPAADDPPCPPRNDNAPTAAPAARGCLTEAPPHQLDDGGPSSPAISTLSNDRDDDEDVDHRGLRVRVAVRDDRNEGTTLTRPVPGNNRNSRMEEKKDATSKRTTTGETIVAPGAKSIAGFRYVRCRFCFLRDWNGNRWVVHCRSRTVLGHVSCVFVRATKV
jgi:hypothetical protein